MSLQVLSFENLTLNQSIWRLKKFDGGGVGWGGVACLIIVSTPGPDFAKVKARFGQVGDQVGDQVDQVKDHW